MGNRLLLLPLFLSIGFALSAQPDQPKQPDVKLKLGKGLQITAADSSLSLRTSIRFQNLFISERDLNDDTGWESSFQIRRARLKFDGWAIDPKLNFYFQLGLSGPDMNNSRDLEETGTVPKTVLDAYIRYQVHPNLGILVGQAILPGNRERVISSQKMQLVDRSIVNAIFNLDRDMGVQVFGKWQSGNMVVKPIFAWALGEGRNVVQNIGGFDYTGRLEVMPFGEFTNSGDYFEGDLAREPKPKLALGVTYNFNNRTARQQQAGIFLHDTTGAYLKHDLQTIYADVMLKYKGFSLHSEVVHKRVSDMPHPSNDANPMEELRDAEGNSYLTGSGFMAQAGYLFKNNWEVALRYSQVQPDFQQAFAAEKEYILGISKYFSGHHIKIQSDVGLLDEAGQDANTLRYRIQFEFGI